MVPREKIDFCLNSVPDSTAREPVQGMGGGGVGGGGRKHTYYIVARGGGREEGFWNTPRDLHYSNLQNFS